MSTIKYVDSNLNEKIVKKFDNHILAHVCAVALQKHARSFYGKDTGYHVVVNNGKSVLYM